MSRLTDEEMIALHPSELMGCTYCANTDLGDRGLHECTKGWTWAEYGRWSDNKRAEQRAKRRKIKVTFTCEVDASSFTEAYALAPGLRVTGAYNSRLIGIEGISE